MGKKRESRMGRPPLPEDEKRIDTIRFRTTAEERELLEAASKAKGLDLSSWMRDVLVRSARAVLRGFQSGTKRGSKS